MQKPFHFVTNTGSVTIDAGRVVAFHVGRTTGYVTIVYQNDSVDDRYNCDDLPVEGLIAIEQAFLDCVRDRAHDNRATESDPEIHS